VTDKPNATRKHSQDIQVPALLTSKYCSGYRSRRHWHNRRRLDMGHFNITVGLLEPFPAF